MTLRTLICRSLSFHARSHLGVLLGAAVGSAALIGALVVGDSVRASLREMALARLGKVELAMSSGDRFFRDRLGGDKISAALQLPGTATARNGAARANQVQILGITSAFAGFAEDTNALARIAADSVVLNDALARQLGAAVGDTVVLRVAKPSLLSRDAPISPQEDASLALRLKVQAVANDRQLGRFSLSAGQVAPFNAFVNRALLQEKVSQTNRANLLLLPNFAIAERSRSQPTNFVEKLKNLWKRISGNDHVVGIGNGNVFDDEWFDNKAGLKLFEIWGKGVNPAIETVMANSSLKTSWHLSDAQLSLRSLPSGDTELRSDRVFLDPPVVTAAQQADTNAQPVITYLVNEIRDGDQTTPYSMVTGMGAPVVPPDMRDNEIILNEWTADDLDAHIGDTVSLAYYVMGNGRALDERTNIFKVRAIIPIAGAAADRTLMPEFPGIAEAESTSSWDAGFPIQPGKIRVKDEQYWKQYRGTPKAFVTVKAGEQMWSNRFGALTALRFPPSAGSLDTIRSNLLSRLDPASVGLHFEPVREQALAASSQATDFGGLFLGFSFFLIVAALLLMALLFQFGLERRTTEIGTLLALGFPPRRVRRLLLGEGAALALLGSLLGALGGIAYARAMLRGLTTVWRDAVGGTSLHYHADPQTLALGVSLSVLVAVLTLWLALRKQARQPARELLAEGATERSWKISPIRKRSRGLWLGLISALLAAAMVAFALAKHDNSSAETFFSAGSLLLIAGLAFSSAWLTVLGRRNSFTKSPGRPLMPSDPLSLKRGEGQGEGWEDKNRNKSFATLTVGMLGLLSSTRRPRRSLATIGLLACGVFLIVAVGAFHLDATQNATQPSSGTGGFALLGEAALPVTYDLNAPAGRYFYGLNDRPLTNVNVVAFRVHDGDEASCLNLNRAQKPRVLGVDPAKLTGRFTFAEVLKGLPGDKNWLLLQTNLGADEIPAIGDENSIQWAMGKKVGDTLDYTDEHGRPFKLRLVASVANSILQGSLIIDEARFIQRFPGDAGYRMFLVDAPSNTVANASAELTRGLQDTGLELTSAAARLNAFNAVQNTYLSTFQVLGGLGLLLGSAGLGIVVLRNVQERRGELALLLAVGFRRRALHWLVLAEHGALLGLGLLVGVVAAVIAVLPALLAPGSPLPYASLALTLSAVLLNGLLWTWLATRFALRGRLLSALRNE